MFVYLKSFKTLLFSHYWDAMYPITSRWSCCVGPGYSLLHFYSRDPDVFLIKFDHGRITQHKYHLGCSSYTLRHDRCLFTLLSLKIKIIYKKEDLSEKLRTFKSSRVCVYKTKNGSQCWISSVIFLYKDGSRKSYAIWSLY